MYFKLGDKVTVTKEHLDVEVGVTGIIRNISNDGRVSIKNTKNSKRYSDGCSLSVESKYIIPQGSSPILADLLMVIGHD